MRIFDLVLKYWDVYILQILHLLSSQPPYNIYFIPNSYITKLPSQSKKWATARPAPNKQKTRHQHNIQPNQQSQYINHLIFTVIKQNKQFLNLVSMIFMQKINLFYLLDLQLCKQVNNIMVNLKMGKEMVKESKFGMISLCMRDSGRKIRLMEEVELYMLMGMCMRGSGGMIRRMGMECTIILMGRVILVNGLMMSIMDMELRNGQMDQFTMEIIKTEKKNGTGKLVWPDGSTFEGDFKQGQIEGKGKFTWPNKKIYEGQWEKNKMNGKGIFLWPDGRRYEGQYVNDLKQGYGKLEWPDGRVYEGQWKAGLQHGQGRSRDKQGNWRQGQWEKGKRI